MSNSLRIFHQLQADLNQIILGQERLIERLLIVLLADGHLLVEGAPGLAKPVQLKLLVRKLRENSNVYSSLRIYYLPM